MKTGDSDLKKLKNCLDGIEQKRLLVIGDIMLDRFIYGAIDRISPESDAPVLDIRRENIMLGGAGNVSANLQTLGAQVTTLAVIGNDDEGKVIQALSKNLTNDISKSYNIIYDGGELSKIEETIKYDTGSETFNLYHVKLLANGRIDFLTKEWNNNFATMGFDFPEDDSELVWVYYGQKHFRNQHLRHRAN